MKKVMNYVVLVLTDLIICAIVVMSVTKVYAMLY